MNDDPHSAPDPGDEQAFLRRRVAELEALVATQQAAADQHRAEQRFATLFRASPVAVVISTADEGRYLDVNHRFCDLSGYTPADVIGRTSTELGIWTDLQERSRIGQMLRDHTLIRDMELTFRTKDGRILTVLASFAPIDLDGRACVLTMCQDITERQQIAAERDRLYNEARIALSARDEFLAIAAHELKTPITSLRGFTQLLLRRMNQQRHIDPESLHHALAVIEQQSQRLQQLIEQVLDVARVQSNQLILNCQPTDLTVAVRQLVTAMQAITAEHPVSIEGSSPVIALVDPLRLDQVVRNLIDNAVKYSPAGSPIEIAIAQPTTDTAEISITDHGIGIAPEQQQRIFERFYRAHRRQDGGGMGLGLYVSQQIVALHDGSLQVEMPAHGGTRFRIRLPIGAVGSPIHQS